MCMKRRKFLCNWTNFRVSLWSHYNRVSDWEYLKKGWYSGETGACIQSQIQEHYHSILLSLKDK